MGSQKVLGVHEGQEYSHKDTSHKGEVMEQCKKQPRRSPARAKNPARARQKRGKSVASSLATPSEQLVAPASNASSLDVHSIAKEAFDAYCDVMDKHKGLIKQFWVAFQERAKDKFLSESQGENGLAFTLEEWLGRYPSRSHRDVAVREPRIAISIDEIERQFRTALEIVARHNPYVLQRLQEVREELEGPEWSLQDILRAQLAKYVANKNALPY